MRTPLLTAALAVAALAAPAAHAQIPSIGVAGGVNFASLGDAVTADLDASTGFHVGVYADLSVGPVGVRPGVFFVRAGDIEGSIISDDEHVDWIAIPVDVRVSTGTPLVKLYALAGPEVRIPTSEVFGEDTRSYAIAGNIGIGAEVGGLLLPNAFAELRYGLDLSGLRDDDAVDESVKVNVIMLRVGVGI